VQQYAVDLEDEVAKSVYKAVGVKRVQWVAEQDERTCGVCHELDGTIYDLKDIPPKQHYQCRCYLIPVRVEK
jgi:SPP1 gp7 family putative phage head morphogenesis protein